MGIRQKIAIMQELDIINPNWKKEVELTELAYLQLLKEIYLLGAKPNELHKLLENPETN